MVFSAMHGCEYVSDRAGTLREREKLGGKMEKRTNLITSILFVAGILEIVVGLGHFAFPELTLKSGGFLRLQADELDFIKTNMIGLGINLTVFGILTIVSSLNYNNLKRLPMYLTLVQAVKYFFRTILELIVPVSIPIYLNDPFIYVLVTVIVLWGLHSLAFMLILRARA